MATLDASQLALVQSLIDYMVLGSAYEKPIDDVVANRLSTLHSEFGYSSQIEYLEGLRDKPFTTLVRSILASSIILFTAGSPLRWLLTYWEGNYEKPLDGRSVEVLLPIFHTAVLYSGDTSLSGDIHVSELLRDAPYSTFLRLLVALGTHHV